MFKCGLKLWSVNTDIYYKEAQSLYQKGVFDYIELYAVPDTTHTIEQWKKLDIPFIIHCPHFAHGFNLAKAEKKDSNLEIYYQVKKFADELNASYIIFHSGIDGTIEETAKQLKDLNEERALIENKPMIALPNRMGGNFCRGYNPDEIQYVIDNTGCGFCLDFGHAVCSANAQKKDIYEYCREFLQFSPKMYHLTDIDDIKSVYDSHPHLGKGQLDLKKVIKMIPDETYVTFETVKNSKENLDDFTEDMEYLKSYTIKNNKNFKLRLAKLKDIKNVFELSNDSVVRSSSINQNPINWDEHIKWFNETINSNNVIFYIIESEDNEFAGQIRIKKGDENVISISLSENFRGKGAAWKIIKECSQKSNLEIITAYIKKNNLSSLNAFTKAGYEISENVLINGIEFYKLKCKIV